jgi:hypothetical protein
MKEKPLQELELHYKGHGVGKSKKARLTYWRTLAKEAGVTYGGTPLTEKQELSAFELEWLADNFPMEYPSC